jgi:Ca-activated chloride channel homolog
MKIDLKRSGLVLLSVMTITLSSALAQTHTRDVAPPQEPGKTGKEHEGSSSKSDDVVKVETDLVTTLFTAVDKERRYVTNLRAEDVRISENGVTQDVSLFERETDRPLSIVILVDASKSQERTIPEERRAAKRFVNAVVRPDRDHVAVVSFTGEPKVELPPSNDLTRINAAIDGLVIGMPPEGCNADILSSEDLRCYTGIWDAVAASTKGLSRVTGKESRRVIILLTDGDDTSSKTPRDDAIKAAVSNDIVLYGIGVGDPELYKIERGSLRKLAEKTGGRAFFPDEGMDLDAAFAQIQEEMRSQYVIAYSPKNKARDGSYRKLKLEIVTQEMKQRKLRLLHREGYYAKTN